MTRSPVGLSALATSLSGDPMKAENGTGSRGGALGLLALATTLLLPAPALPGPSAREIEPAEPTSPPPLFLELAVPLLRQSGDLANCGPTAAAMLLGAHRGLREPAALDGLRDALGLWSWQRFPLRQWRLPGRDPGMTTPFMMETMLERFGEGLRFRRLEHPVLPSEAWSLVALRESLASGRPLLTLTESPVLWGTDSKGLHWIVVTGLEDDLVVYHDPADGRRCTVPIDRFWRAWRLSDLLQKLPGVDPFVAFVSETPLPALDPELPAM